MKKVQTILATIFWVLLLTAALTVVVFETSLMETGILAGRDNNVEFLVTMTFELLTLASVPVALKLFKFKRIHGELVTEKAPAMLRWGTVRLLLLLALLQCNTLLYYIYMNTAFGYMALIIVLCLPFVYPSMGRCLAETEDEVAEEKTPEEAS